MNSKKIFELKGKVAIVTGSSKGIGLAIARGLSENGANVVLSSRSQESVELAANQFQKYNPTKTYETIRKSRVWWRY